MRQLQARFGLVATFVLLLFTASMMNAPAQALPEGLPSWFKDLDTDDDGQISLREWLAGGKKLAEFREYDLNDDGFITPAEVLRVIRRPFELKLKKGQASYQGAIEASDEKYQNKIAKIFTVRLEAGKKYQFDHMSKAFDAYLYLEGPDGNILAQDDDSGGNLNSRIIHRAAKTGVYRLAATSLPGSATGAFTFAVKVVAAGGKAGGEGGLPPWFKELDKDGDGQISLREWLDGGKKLAEFREYDINDDGFITSAEVLKTLGGGTHLQLRKGQASYEGAIDAASDGKYQNK